MPKRQLNLLNRRPASMRQVCERPTQIVRPNPHLQVDAVALNDPEDRLRAQADTADLITLIHLPQDSATRYSCGLYPKVYQWFCPRGHGDRAYTSALSLQVYERPPALALLYLPECH